MTDRVLSDTRRALHAVAELVLAGPQHRRSATIKLRVVPGGFGTVAEPTMQVAGTDVIAGERAVPIDGQTARALAASLGVDDGGPPDVYSDGCGVSLDEVLVVDPDVARRLHDAYALGDEALRLLEPGTEPVLWPEHFDVAIRVGGINFGVSPGDGFRNEPYAYVGVDPVPAGPFWNAPFGRIEPMTQFGDPATLQSFFAEGRSRFADASPNNAAG